MLLAVSVGELALVRVLRSMGLPISGWHKWKEKCRRGWLKLAEVASTLNIAYWILHKFMSSVLNIMYINIVALR